MYNIQARRQRGGGGVRGVCLNPPFGLQKFHTMPSPIIYKWSTYSTSLISNEYHHTAKNTWLNYVTTSAWSGFIEQFVSMIKEFQNTVIIHQPPHNSI